MGRRRATGCITGKIRFRDHDEATRRLHRMTFTKAGRDRMPVRCYPCGFCKGWHLTGQTDRYGAA